MTDEEIGKQNNSQHLSLRFNSHCSALRTLQTTLIQIEEFNKNLHSENKEHVQELLSC